KTSILQVPPQQGQSGRTPYLDALYSAWEGSRFLGCRVGFVSENQILSGKLKKIKLLIVPAEKYTRPEVIAAVKSYINEPETIILNQHAQENNGAAEFGINIASVTPATALGKRKKLQNCVDIVSHATVYGLFGTNPPLLNADMVSTAPTGLRLV